ncbi:hypothetical protein JHK86_043906 [Glycine max]|nr:hypothetical protein JHK86_057284 [Glycine max]KAG4906048.1 hypothetical protein JHK86_057295 [Glycine max]KAG4950667.1 hypothetical protein JHK86_043906 [Glycine max]
MRFKTCRLLSGNVRNRELTIIQRRVLRRLRNKKRSIKRKISPRKNMNSYIQSQTTRKLPLFHADLPITEMHRGTERTSYIPFLLNPETRSDVIPVRLHFRETIPQARQPISHRRVCVNNRIVSITRLKVSHGDLISFQENDARIRGEEIRRSFYIEISVDKIIGKFLDHPVRMWRRTKTEWFHLLKTKRGCRLLLKSRFLQQQLRYSMQEEYLERTKNGKALQSEVLRLGEEMFLVDAGPGTPRICMQDEPTGVPINRATRFENKVGSLDLVAGESLIKKKILERFFIDLVAGESLIKERAAARFNDLVGSTDVVAGEPLLLLPRRFRQNLAWMELNKIWRTNTKVKGFIIDKVKKGGYSVAIAGFITFLPFRSHNKRRRKKISNDRFTIESINPKRTNIVVF